MVDAAGVAAGDLVVDLGAGTGALVRPLLAVGATVVAVELHDGRLAVLRTGWPDQIEHRQLMVVRADALGVRLPRRPFAAVCNPPYAIGSQVVQRLLGPNSRLQRAAIVLPTPVARRFVEGRAPGAGRWLREYRVEIGLRLPRTAFQPPPKVGSAVLLVRRA